MLQSMRAEDRMAKERTMGPKDYSKGVWVQPTKEAPWRRIDEVCTDGVVTWFRNGVRTEPFDFDRERQQAHRAAEHHVRTGSFVVYEPS